MKDLERTKEQRLMSRRELFGSAAAVVAFTMVPSHILGAAAAPPGLLLPPGGGWPADLRLHTAGDVMVRRWRALLRESGLDSF